MSNLRDQIADMRASGYRAMSLAALTIIAERLEKLESGVAALAPDSAPPVPVTAPPTEPTAASMTVEQFYAELDAIELGVKRDGVRNMRVISRAITLAVDLGARWRAATGLPLPVRPR